jgi:putative flippase GtrA
LSRQPLKFGPMPSDVYTRARAHPLAKRLAQSAFAAKVTKYAIGSVIALVTSVVVFAVMYWLGVNTTVDSVVAFAAGAVPNWVLNRRWAWRITGRTDFMREIVAYVAISLIVLAASSGATGWMHHWVNNHVDPGDGLRVILVTGSYVFVQAVLFVAKFVIYEKWVFAGESRLRAAFRSRRQVWTAARANRTP